MFSQTTRTQTAVMQHINYSLQNGKGDMVEMPGLRKKLHIPYNQARHQSAWENVGYVVWLDIRGTDAGKSSLHQPTGESMVSHMRYNVRTNQSGEYHPSPARRG